MTPVIWPALILLVEAINHTYNSALNPHGSRPFRDKNPTKEPRPLHYRIDYYPPYRASSSNHITRRALYRA
ncbi:uncharacterized protein FTOL_13788 [Fusarium torulosum]|uniref:Secreted protein n=1 Tax=Fusarium torulosum TaxID=33205 RepID=A0AAE8SQ67_9HYPO|nr:uncharacterized protein FTOL_13788 [Fusarium torulosum]